MSVIDRRRAGVVVGISLVLNAGVVFGQAIQRPPSAAPLQVVMPQIRSYHAGGGEPLEITQVEVGVVVVGQVATTTMDVDLRNHGGIPAEAELVVPVPAGAAVRSFTFQGEASEGAATVLPVSAAQDAYERIVARLRDPALLEFAGHALVRSSVFPVPAGGTQTIRLTYEHLLPRTGARVDYELPRSESLAYNVPWRVSVKIKSTEPISTVYSPTHALETVRRSENVLSVRLASTASHTPGPFRLSYLLAGNEIAASLFAFPDPRNDSTYFLLLAGLPAADGDQPGPGIKRELTLVLDRSGSMRGAKIEQVREAALQVIAGLNDGESFNIITYNDTVESFAPAPVPKTAASAQEAAKYLSGIIACGGTNLYDALRQSLIPKPEFGRLPLVLFLTDGLPTVGETSEVAIRRLAGKSNRYARRVFTFGAGVDVNAPLLDAVALKTGGTSTYVLPGEDVEVKVGQVFRKLTGPVLTGPILEAKSDKIISPIYDVVPARLPDLFAGDQLVVLGKYRGTEPMVFMLRGNYRGKPSAFLYEFDLKQASRKHTFVPRLWASRRIGVLVDALRELGAEKIATAADGAGTNDPRVRELVDEVVRLSTEYGVLTEYTAFLAHEGTDLSKRDEVLAEAARNFDARAWGTRSGTGAVNQSLNAIQMQGQVQLNASNSFFRENLERVSVATVQQINDLAFYRRNDRWIDSRAVQSESKAPPARVIEFGSDEFRALVRQLIGEERQGALALGGDVVIVVGDETVLVRCPQK